MKELRTTLYDIKGYFVPGTLFLWGVLELISLCGYSLDSYIQKMPASFMAVATVTLAYVTGHALHALANWTVDKIKSSLYPPKFYFDEPFNSDFSLEQRQELQAIICDMYQQNAGDYTGDNAVIKSSYWPCFQFVMTKQAAELENFLSITGFYRGITAAFGTTFVIYTAGFFVKHSIVIAGIAFMSALLCGAFFTRVSRFNGYLAKTVYSNFLNLAQASQTPSTMS